MNKRFYDFTGTIYDEVDLLKESVSFERSAYIVANSFLNGLVKSGLSVEQAYNVYLSKAFRHELDGNLEDKLERIALKAGQQVGEEFKKLAKVNKEMYGWINDNHHKEVQKELDKRMEPEFA